MKHLTFVDFEHSTIKPFILASYPSFVAYQGAKIFNLEQDVPEYETMDDVDKQQYQFMYYKTRNERLWEYALNSKRHDLIAVALPHVKVLKAPYLQALECKSDKDYLFVENAIVQLQAMWNVYVANGLVNTEESGFPIKYSHLRWMNIRLLWRTTRPRSCPRHLLPLVAGCLRICLLF